MKIRRFCGGVVGEWGVCSKAVRCDVWVRLDEILKGGGL